MFPTNVRGETVRKPIKTELMEELESCPAADGNQAMECKWI
jgi:hypothetical protein